MPFSATKLATAFSFKQAISLRKRFRSIQMKTYKANSVFSVVRPLCVCVCSMSRFVLPHLETKAIKYWFGSVRGPGPLILRASRKWSQQPGAITRRARLAIGELLAAFSRVRKRRCFIVLGVLGIKRDETILSRRRGKKSDLKFLIPPWPVGEEKKCEFVCWIALG